MGDHSWTGKKEHFPPPSNRTPEWRPFKGFRLGAGRWEWLMSSPLVADLQVDRGLWPAKW